jgi:hypothetical protein
MSAALWKRDDGRTMMHSAIRISADENDGYRPDISQTAWAVGRVVPVLPYADDKRTVEMARVVKAEFEDGQWEIDFEIIQPGEDFYQYRELQQCHHDASLAKATQQS